MCWVKHRLNHLRNWKKSTEAVVKAIKDLGVKAEAYVIGGAAEGRLTVLSDIDILICINISGHEKKSQLRKQILATAMDKYGLPWDYPIELHVHTQDECEEILKHAKKYVKLLLADF